MNASGRDEECLIFLNEIEAPDATLEGLAYCPRKLRAFENKMANGLIAVLTGELEREVVRLSEKKQADAKA